MSAAKPLDYADRCERYARQRGWAYAPNRISIGHLTPRQRRRALAKENRAINRELMREHWESACYDAGPPPSTPWSLIESPATVDYA